VTGYRLRFLSLHHGGSHRRSLVGNFLASVFRLDFTFVLLPSTVFFPPTPLLGRLGLLSFSDAAVLSLGSFAAIGFFFC